MYAHPRAYWHGSLSGYELLSPIFGVLDRKGGIRTIISQEWDIAHHLQEGERVFMVPGVRVKDPPDWNQIPWIVRLATHQVQKSLAPVNHCQECKACCITPRIEDESGFKKHSHHKCPKLDKGFGCMEYHRRPGTCQRFECLWLRSQRRNDIMGPELRPDRCGVIFTDDSHGDPDVFEVHPIKPHELGPDVGPAREFINREQASGRKAKLITYYYGEIRR